MQCFQLFRINPFGRVKSQRPELSEAQCKGFQLFRINPFGRDGTYTSREDVKKEFPTIPN